MATAVEVSPISGRRFEPLDDLMNELSLQSNVSDAFVYEEASEHVEEEEIYVTPYDEAYEWAEGNEKINRKGFTKPSKSQYIETVEENERFQSLINHEQGVLNDLNRVHHGFSDYEDLSSLGTDIPYSTTLEISMGEVTETFVKEVIEHREQHSYLCPLDDTFADPEPEPEPEPVVYYLPEVSTPAPVEVPRYVCAACTQIIVGRCITAMMRKFHPECFVCSYCLKQLNKGSFKESDDKPYCHTCFDRLYG